MKNYEKYADEIRECKGIDFCCSFIRPNILKSEDCGDTACSRCQMLQMLWLLEEYEEPEIDWSKVEVDTPILVKDDAEMESWLRGYFAKFEDGVVYTWKRGKTSWTTLDDRSVFPWNYAKLAESEEE